MKITTIAYVRSSKDNTKEYTVTLRGNRWECDCKAFYFSENRGKPCKHIKAVRTTDRVPKGELVQKRVRPTPKGVKLIHRFRRDKRRREALSPSAAR